MLLAVPGFPCRASGCAMRLRRRVVARALSSDKLQNSMLESLLRKIAVLLPREERQGSSVTASKVRGDSWVTLEPLIVEVVTQLHCDRVDVDVGQSGAYELVDNDRLCQRCTTVYIVRELDNKFDQDALRVDVCPGIPAFFQVFRETTSGYLRKSVAATLAPLVDKSLLKLEARVLAAVAKRFGEEVRHLELRLSAPRASEVLVREALWGERRAPSVDVSAALLAVQEVSSLLGGASLLAVAPACAKEPRLLSAPSNGGLFARVVLLRDAFPPPRRDVHLHLSHTATL